MCYDRHVVENPLGIVGLIAWNYIRHSKGIERDDEGNTSNLFRYREKPLSIFTRMGMLLEFQRI